MYSHNNLRSLGLWYSSSTPKYAHCGLFACPTFSGVWPYQQLLTKHVYFPFLRGPSCSSRNPISLHSSIPTGSFSFSRLNSSSSCNLFQLPKAPVYFQKFTDNSVLCRAIQRKSTRFSEYFMAVLALLHGVDSTREKLYSTLERFRATQNSVGVTDWHKRVLELL